MTVDDLRIELVELKVEYSGSKKIAKQLQNDIDDLDSIMRRNFDAYWDSAEQNYTQGL